jgi:hypothetical protein
MFKILRVVTPNSIVNRNVYICRQNYKQGLKAAKFILKYYGKDPDVKTSQAALARAYQQFKKNLSVSEIEYTIQYTNKKLLERINNEETGDFKYIPKLPIAVRFIYNNNLSSKEQIDNGTTLTTYFKRSLEEIRKAIKVVRTEMKKDSFYFPEGIVGGEDKFIPDNNGGQHKYVVHEDCVNYKPGQYYDIYLAKLATKIYEEKQPTSNNNYVGIEIEFHSKADRHKLAAEFMKAGLVKYLNLTIDGSLRPPKDYIGHELRCLIEEKEVFDVIPKICEVLRKCDSGVNGRCGLHVHLDMRNREKGKVFKNLILTQPILYSMQSKLRREAEYCQIFNNTNLDEQTPNPGRNDGHYWGINGLDALRRHTTFEVRIHSGTINATKISNWVKLLLYIVNRKEAFKESQNSFVKFYECEKSSFDHDLATYVLNRIMKHVKNVNDEDDSL